MSSSREYKDIKRELTDEDKKMIEFLYLEKGRTPDKIGRRIKLNPEIIKRYVKEETNLYEQKMRKSLKEKYGEDIVNIGQATEVKKKIKQTFQRYEGGHPFKDPEIKERIRENFQEKYHADCYMQTEEFREKSKQTNIKKYGVESFTLTDKCKNSGGKSISKINKAFAELLKLNQIEFQQEFVIENKLYDFYLPDYNILVEIDPTYTHNSTKGAFMFSGEKEPVEKYYHYNKSKLAREHGYVCIHKFDWNSNEEVLNLIKNIDKYNIIQNKEPKLYWIKFRRSNIAIPNSSNINRDEMINKNCVEVYDDGQEFLLK